MSSCPEVAADAALLIDPRNPQEISYAIDQICSDEPLRQELIRKGSMRCKEFSWKKYGVEIKKIYDLA
jgi:glycosyltransferase involved in cell wall biosynthesis